MTVGTLADLLPAVASAVGASQDGRSRSSLLPAARVVVVMLVDGLGDAQLGERGGHAPFLRSLRTGATLSSGFPSTTATSLGMFGTGLLPGAHGLVGTDVLDPERDVVFNELRWDPDVDPHRWQPWPTVFEQLDAAGYDVVRVGPGFFDGSGLTEATTRGGRFLAAEGLEARVDLTLDVARAGHGLVYLYWGDLDKVGHEHGCGSWAWIAELERIDAAARRLAARLPSDAVLVVTSDHGMVDVPFESRVDIATQPDLAAGIRHVGGEARALHLYCRDGAAADVAAAWRERLSPGLEVVTRDDAVRRGWFGPVDPRVLPRIGDVVATARDLVAVVDSRTARPESLALVGLHGARTDAEMLVPLLVTPGAASV